MSTKASEPQSEPEGSAARQAVSGPTALADRGGNAAATEGVRGIDAADAATEVDAADAATEGAREADAADAATEGAGKLNDADAATEAATELDDGDADSEYGGKTLQAVSTVDDLIRAAFISRGRVLKVPDDALRQVPADDTSQQQALVRELAAGDPTMAGAFRLLQFVARNGVDPNRGNSGSRSMLNRLCEFAVVAMTGHPVFRHWENQLSDPSLEPPLTARAVHRIARSTRAKNLGLAKDEFGHDKQRQLQSNAVACFALLRLLRGDWSLDDFVDALRDNNWAQHATSETNHRRTAAAIAANRDHDVLEAVSSRFLRTVTVLERRNDSLTREAAASANREARLEDELQAARAREADQTAMAEEYSVQIVRLQEELAHERENRAVDRSHMSDDYEILRTRIIRVVGSEIGLLTDGLHALRNGAPDVADEFLDRSLSALSREVRELRAPGGAE